jgi:DNA-binding MurR/RpiR family transcriptional regulator
MSQVIKLKTGGAQAPKQTSLEQRVAGAGGRLSRRRRDMLQRLLDNPDETFFLSLRRLANHLSIDPATLSRTIQALGYDGFVEFAADLRQHFVSRVTPYSVMRGAADERRTVHDHVAHGLVHDLDNVSRMQSALDLSDIEKAASQLCQARRVLVVGVDLAYAMSYWLAYSLNVIGINAEAPQDRAMLFYKTQLLTRDDALVAISFRRCMKSTVEALIAAKAHSTHTLAITDSLNNPLGKRADISLLTSVEGPVVTGSQVAPFALLNALVIACSQLRASRTLDLLRVVHSEYEQGDRWFKEEN